MNLGEYLLEDKVKPQEINHFIMTFDDGDAADKCIKLAD